MLLTEAEVAEARAVAAATHDCEVVARTRGTAGGWDPIEGAQPEQPGETLYDGMGRVQAVRGTSGAVDAAGQPVVVRAYKIGLPWDAPDLPKGALLEVRSHPRDPLMVGKVLTVDQVTYGDPGIERTVYARLDLSNQGGGAE